MGQLERIEEKLDQILKLLANEHERTPSPPPEPEQPRPATGHATRQDWQRVSGLFARRYEQARQLPWSSGPHVQALQDIAQAARSTAAAKGLEFDDVLNTALYAFFKDDYAIAASFPPGLLSKQWGRFYAPPPPRAADGAEKAAQARVDAERRHSEKLAQKLARDREQATPPPPGLLEVVKGGRR